MQRTQKGLLLLSLIPLAISCTGRLADHGVPPGQDQTTPAGNNATTADMGTGPGGADQGTPAAGDMDAPDTGPGNPSDMDTASADMPGEDMAPPLPPFEPLPTEVYLRKTKLLLHGGAVTDAELAAVRQDPAALKGLIAGWLEEEPAKQKLREFFIKSFQQDDTDRNNLVGQIRGRQAAGTFNPPDIFNNNLRESFARTVMRIVYNDEPFTSVANTTEFEMTTAMLSFLVASDRVNLRGNSPAADKAARTHRFYNEPFEDYDANTPLARQIRDKTWYVNQPFKRPNDDKCNTGVWTEWDQALVFSALLGYFGCVTTNFAGPIKRNDFEDWRTVKVVPLAGGDREDYYNIPALRQADTIALSTPRVGYFTTPTFLAKWQTNVDNSFRVTANQSLIVGLGHSFEPEGFTMPFTVDNLSEEHAAPTTVCYGCHISLDPMRNYFANTFDADSYGPLESSPNHTPSFGFRLHQVEGTTLYDFGEALSTHPEFAAGWVQKVCMMATSRPCDPQDEEFIRIVDLFVGSNYNFKTMLVELFASPLVTNASRTVTHITHPAIASLSRRDHYCHALKVRFGDAGYDFDPCDEIQLSVAFPEDAWTRGSTSPFQSTESSLFYWATLEAFCTQLAQKAINKEGSPIQSSKRDETIDFLVTQLVGLPPSNSRHEPLSTLLHEHWDESVEEFGNKPYLITLSVATLACSSAYMASPDF